MNGKSAAWRVTTFIILMNLMLLLGYIPKIRSIVLFSYTFVAPLLYAIVITVSLATSKFVLIMSFTSSVLALTISSWLLGYQHSIATCYMTLITISIMAYVIEVLDRRGVKCNPLVILITSYGVGAFYYNLWIGLILGTPLIIGSVTYLIASITKSKRIASSSLAISITLLSWGLLLLVMLMISLRKGPEIIVFMFLLITFLITPGAMSLYVIIKGKYWSILQLYDEEIVDDALDLFKQMLNERGIRYEIIKGIQEKLPLLMTKHKIIYLHGYDVKITIREWPHYVRMTKMGSGTIVEVNKSIDKMPKEIKCLIAEFLERLGYYEEAAMWKRGIKAS
ncbi:MAG: hypothetical protein DRZ82_08955 [Thermoprotei archaeon]|nr:MAG: hypothetical protein DRZ82_08955 [Thermoprotei archaeon]